MTRLDDHRHPCPSALPQGVRLISAEEYLASLHETRHRSRESLAEFETSRLDRDWLTTIDEVQKANTALVLKPTAESLSASAHHFVTTETIERLRANLNRESLAGYFDEVYLVNLPRETGKRLASLKHYGEFGIWPKLWNAQDGYASPLREEFEAYQQRPIGSLYHAEYNSLEQDRGFHFISSAGAWGYIRTYQAILADALSRHFQRILILEDDVLLRRDFVSAFTNLVNRIPSDWKVLQLGASQYDWQPVGDINAARSQGYYHATPLHTCGSFAMGLDHSIFRELLQHLEPMDSPFDFIPLGKLYENHAGHCFVAYPNLVMPDVTTSSIRSSRDQVDHARNMKWPVDQFSFPRARVEVTVGFSDVDQISLKIGESNLDREVHINWLYVQQGSIRPIHSLDDIERCRLIPHTEADSSEQIERTVLTLSRDLRCDFLLILEPGSVISEQQLKSHIEELVQGTFTASKSIRTICLDSSTTNGGSLSSRLAANNVLNDPSRRNACSSLDATIGGEPRWLLRDPQTTGDDQPLISVIIPTFRRPEHLKQAVQSVLDQTCSSLEIIVVDDNDSETSEARETRLVMQDFSADHRVRYIEHGTNRGGAAARNAGIMHARGEYISFLDDDDVYLPGKVEASLDVLRSQSPTIGGVYTGYVGWNSSESDPTRYREGKLTRQILELAHSTHYLCTNTATYRRSALLRINGYDESFKRHQDLELNLRFFEFYEMAVVPQVFVSIRPMPTSVDNLLDGPGLLEVKRKFLTKFRTLIARLTPADQKRVYEAHWKEVVRYFGGKGQFLEFLRSPEQGELASIVVAMFDDAIEQLAKGKTSVLSELVPALTEDSENKNQTSSAAAVALGRDWTRVPSLEQIGNLLRALEGNGPSALQIRDLPRLLCLALDLREALQTDNWKQARQTFNSVKHLLDRPTNWLVRTCLNPQGTAVAPQFKDPLPRNIVAALRELILGPTLLPSWLDINKLGVGHSDLIGWYHEIPLRERMNELVSPSTDSYQLGKFECIARKPNGILLHPNSDSNLVSLRLKSPTTEFGSLQGLIVQQRNQEAAPALIYVSRSPHFSNSPLLEVLPGTENCSVVFPVEPRVDDTADWYVGVRVPSGAKPHGVHLTLTGILVRPRQPS